MHDGFSLKQKNSLRTQSNAVDTVRSSKSNYKIIKPFWSHFSTCVFVFDTSVCQSPSSAYIMNINTVIKKTLPPLGLIVQTWNSVCMYVRKRQRERERDQVQLYIIPIRLCLFIYMCICFFLWQNLQTYSTEDVQTLNLWARGVRAARTLKHRADPDKLGRHMVNHSALQTRSALTKCT